jgi:mono/diheme cytochrome c family protein
MYRLLKQDGGWAGTIKNKNYTGNWKKDINKLIGNGRIIKIHIDILTEAMKKNNIITAFTLLLAAASVMTGCIDSKRQPGKIYMPDMTYSRALETYALLNDTVFTDNASNPGHEIFYNRKPVIGTIAVGELFPYTLPNDSNGYKLSAEVKNPLAPLDKKDMYEAGRLFNINCAVCHGATGVANGPLSTKIGAIANLTSPTYVAMADGTMFHSINYGKNNMGSYASQLSRKQRWMIIQYVRTLQPKAETSAGMASAKTDSTAAKTDSVTKKA